MARKAFVTGSAGFIGYHLCQRLLAEGWQVLGLDGMSDYYDVTLKQRRHAMLSQSPGFRAVEGLLESPGLLRSLMDEFRPDVVVHLAAQAGVRHSIDAPRSYVEANLIGTFELASAMLFDTGVFLTVFGAVMLALAQLSHIAQRAARAARKGGEGGA